MKARLLAALTITAMAAPAAAQTPPSSQAPGYRIATQGDVPADPADVATIEAIMAAAYEAISGPAGQARDWNRLRSLFTADARLMPLGEKGLRVGGVEDYIRVSGPALVERGFFERELGRVTERYGNIAHIFSAYEARNRIDGPVIARGINSFQLVRHGGRWWIVSIMWQPETPDNPIPQRYLEPHQK